MATYRLARMPWEDKCEKCGRTIAVNEVAWKKVGTGWFCVQCEPEMEDWKRRSVFGRAKSDALKQLCFALGLAEHGRRHTIYHARKSELIELLMGGEKPEGKPRPAVVASSPPAQIGYSEEDVRRVVEEAMNLFAASQVGLVPKLVADELAKREPTIVEVKQKGGKHLALGLQHYLLPRLLRYVSCRLNVYLVGPAGSGKTRAAREVAKALGLQFYAESVSQQTPVHKLMGYRDANGRYLSTAFRQAFEKGGIFLLDEMDAGNPNVLAAFNAAVAAEAGETISFPDKMVKKHKDFICVGAANTFGRGGDREYVGRNPLDAATLDRFVMIEWDYDEALEEAICKKAGWDSSWVKHVQACRQAAGVLRIRLVVSPRACFFGGRLLAAGCEWEEIEKAVMFKGLDEGSVEKIRARISA